MTGPATPCTYLSLASVYIHAQLGADIITYFLISAAQGVVFCVEVMRYYRIYGFEPSKIRPGEIVSLFVLATSFTIFAVFSVWTFQMADLAVHAIGNSHRVPCQIAMHCLQKFYPAIW